MSRGIKVLIGIHIAVVLAFLFFWLSYFQDETILNPVVQSPDTQDNRPAIRVGDDYNYPPYSYLDENGEPTGYNIELIRAVADVMGYRVDFQLMPWSEVLSGLKNGELDLAAGMFYTEERADTFAFSTKHSVTYGDIFSRIGDRVSSLEELRGKSVAVLEADIMEEYLKQQDLDMNFVEVDSVVQALSLVSNGLVDYAGVLKPTGLYLSQAYHYENLVANDLSLAPQEYCIAARADQEHWIYLVNGGMQILKANGTYEEIYNRWLGVYEAWSIRHFVNKHWMLLFGLAFVGLLLIEAIIILQILVKKRTKELERAHGEQLAVETKHRVLLRAVPDMIVHMNTNGDILDYSDHHPTLQVLAKSGDLYSAIQERVGLQQMQRMMEIVQRVARDGQIATNRFELDWDGLTHHYEFRIMKLNDTEVMIMVRDITKPYQDQMKIKYLSEHDQLTGLTNRRFFEREMLRLDESGINPISVIMIDVNGLKLINDSFGHNKGDELLGKVASILWEVCPEGGSASRIGGDEFVVLLPSINYEETRMIVARIHEKCMFEQVAGLDLSVSIGWATKSDLMESVKDVLIKAEGFMYKEKLLEAPGMHGEAINTIIHALYEKNRREEAHSQRVSKLSYELARALDLPDQDCQDLKMAGLLHDIGKIAIPEYILNKPGRLTDQEFLEIKKHPEIGFRILGSMNSMAELAEYVLCHHERWDGKGYPQGREKDEIPLLARIITLADSYDAMTSSRSYKNAMTEWEAIQEIECNLGTQFDPLLGRVFIDQVLTGIVEELDA